MPVPTLLPTAWLPTWQDPSAPLPLTAELRPVVLDYGERLYALENTSMGGPTSSPVFGATVAQADVYWRFAIATGRGTWLPTDAATTWRDTALAGSLLALNRLVDETVERAPQIAALRTAADLLVNPNLELRAPAGAMPRVGHQTGGNNQRKLSDQELLQGLPLDHRPDPKIGVGVDWSTRSPDAPDDAPAARIRGLVRDEQHRRHQPARGCGSPSGCLDGDRAGKAHPRLVPDHKRKERRAPRRNCDVERWMFVDHHAGVGLDATPRPKAGFQRSR